MIYALLAIMTVVIFAYVVAWAKFPRLRKLLEGPGERLLENSESFERIEKNRGTERNEYRR